MLENTTCGLDLISFPKKIRNIHRGKKKPLPKVFQSVWNERKKVLTFMQIGVLQWNWHIPAKEFEMMIIIMVMYLLGSLLPSLAMQSLAMSIHTNVLFKCRSVRQILCIPNTYIQHCLLTTGCITKIWISSQWSRCSFYSYHTV